MKKRRKEVVYKTLAGLMITAMSANAFPMSTLAVTDQQLAKDGTYSATARVSRTEEDDENEDEWNEYNVTVSLVVEGGKFSSFSVTKGSEYEDSNDTYFNKAVTGKKGLVTKMKGQDATADTVQAWDSVSGATRTSDAVRTALIDALAKAEEVGTAEKVETAELEKLIEDAAQYIQGEHTEDTWTVFSDALEAAKQAVADKESQTAVDTAKSNLLQAIEQLQKVSKEVDVITLKEVIDAADALKAEDYTKDSWDAFSEALAQAKSVYETKESQDAVDAQVKNLRQAMENLKKPVEEKVEYVLMNIPYDKFYAAEVNNDVKVDVFSSATLNKTRTGSMVAGSYHVDPLGTDITGVTYAVKLPEDFDLGKYTQVTDASSVDITVTNRGQASTTTYAGKEALFESPSYSYYILSEKPAYYKEATVNADGSLSFGKAVGAVQTVSGVEADFATKSNYGDYQLDISGLDVVGRNTKVYGIVIGTKEGSSYGLRHMENIWFNTSLSWATGFTTSVHGCPTSSDHYKAMMGQTINKITYYTENGIFEAALDDIYVPVKFAGSVTAADTAVTAGKIELAMNDIPSDFDAVYSVEGLSDVRVEGNTLSYNAAEAKKGQYTLVIKDAGGKYTDLTTNFVLTAEAIPVAYDAEENKLVKTAEATAEDFADYIKNITSVNVNGKDYAATGRNAVVIINEDGSIKTDAKPFEEGTIFEIIVKSTGYKAVSFTYEKEEAPYKYVYAGLSWSEYWSAEGVMAAGSTVSSDEKDSKGELDRGAFDTVTRATTNHGVHRGSFQCTTTIYMKDGTIYDIAAYTGNTTAILTNGETVTYNKGDIDHYVVTGLKYVPVKVAAEDYEAFAKAYAVVENDETIRGGFSENKLSAYTAQANVTEDTNGLKVVTKNADGTFSFSSRSTGADSGIKDAALKVASPTVAVKEASGSYGEFLRVDLVDDFGDLGSSLQAVKWVYYGNDSTRSNAIASYGTKFAADNWMHKSMGIQLGLTESERCRLPEGTDGTGYWTLTVYALGYADYTVDFEATEDHIVKADPVTDTSKLEALIQQAENLIETDYTADSWAAMQVELAEAREELEAKHSQSAVEEAANHLSVAIQGLIKAETSIKEVNTSALEKAIQEAEALKKDDYTSESYLVLEVALKEAKEVLNEKESQERVDQAEKTLQAAKEGLKKAEQAEDNNPGKPEDNKPDNTEDNKPGQPEDNKADKPGDNKPDQPEDNKPDNTEDNKTEKPEDNRPENSEDNKTENQSNQNTDKPNNNNTAKPNSSGTNSANTNVPKTGDPMNIWGLWTMALSSLGACGLGIKIRNKKKKEDEE